jgi:hypothetical protein
MRRYRWLLLALALPLLAAADIGQGATKQYNNTMDAKGGDVRLVTASGGIEVAEDC